MIYDARDFGARGDGITCDGAALQAWLDAIPPGGTGFLPAADFDPAAVPEKAYILDRTLIRRSPISIRGEGHRSVIRFVGGATAMQFDHCRFSTFSNFRLVASDHNFAANVGLCLRGAQECVQIDQVFIDGFKGVQANGAALMLMDSWDVAISGGGFRQSGTGIHCDDSNFSSGAGVVNVVNAIGVDCSDTGTGPVYRSGAVLNVFGCDFTGAGVAIDIGAFVTHTHVGTVNITGNWFEGSGAGVRVGFGRQDPPPPGTVRPAPKDIDIRNNFFSNTGEQIHLYFCDRARIGENQWGPGSIVIDERVTRTTIEARGVTIIDASAPGQTGYYGHDQLIINEIIARNALRVGTGALVTRLLSGSSAVDFPSVAHGSHASATLTVAGAEVGDIVTGVSHTAVVPAGVLLAADVTSGDTVTVKLVNQSGAAVNLPAGTVKVVVARVT